MINMQTLPEIKHPRTDYTLKQAVDLAVSNATTFDRKVPETLSEVREYIVAMYDRIDHNWITGMVALDVLDMAIDGEDNMVGFRYA